MTRIRLIGILLCILAGAAIFRFRDLDRRPVHTDEAVHAVKLNHLLQQGRYEYEPREYHGPILYYVSAWFANLFGIESGDTLTITFLRGIPAAAGLLLVLTPLFFADGLGKRAMLMAAGLLAFSPAFIFYSRYYIHEIFLTLFLACFLGCLGKFCHTQKTLWILLTGLFAGLMIVTKETVLLCFVAAAMAGLIVFWASNRKIIRFSKQPVIILTAIAIAGMVWLLFFSSFGSNWQGPLDSLRYFAINIQHAQGQGGHQHPWFYYLDLLTWLEFFEPITWNEDGIVALAALACLAGLLKNSVPVESKSLFRFLVWFTVILTALYSAIPYKTPWNVLPFLYGMALLAGVAADAFLRQADTRNSKIAIIPLLAVFCLISPIVQSAYLNFKFSADPHNPYVYGQTGQDISGMQQQVEKAAASWPEGKDLYIQVFAPEDDYWPWPWLLREYSNVGYWNQVDPEIPPAPLILANAAMERQLLGYLYELQPAGQRDMYLPLFEEYMEIRPGIEWRGYIRKDYWDRMRRQAIPKSNPLQPVTLMQLDPSENQIHKFSHNAMAAVFEIWIDHDDSGYAQSAANAAFEEIDRIEQLLSRYIPSSDISRISRLSKGHSVTVSPETIECLQISFEANHLTGGVFDITVGRLVDERKRPDDGRAERIDELRQRTGMHFLQINREALMVTVQADQLNLDLGGIGKGYALEKAADILRQWNIPRAMIHGGASSILVMESPKTAPEGWKVRLINPLHPKEEITTLQIKNQTLSCSGLRRIADMIDPASGRAISDKVSTWVIGPNAAMCDALSTACMIMSYQQIRELQIKMPGYAIMVLPKSQNEDHHEFIQYGF